MNLTTADLEQIGRLLDDRLKGVHQRLDGVEQRLDGVGDALIYLANCWPGTMPGHKSHVAREVEKILKPGSKERNS